MLADVDTLSPECLRIIHELMGSASKLLENGSKLSVVLTHVKIEQSNDILGVKMAISQQLCEQC